MKQYQKGVVHLAAVIIVIVIALAAILYLVFTNKGTQVGTSGIPGLTQKATESDFSFIEDPLVKKHYTAQANVAAYRTKSDTTSLPGSTGVNFTEVQTTADAYNHYDWQEKDGKRTSEIITLGDTVYVKDYSDNKWWKQAFKQEELQELEEENELKPEDPTEFAKMPKITHKSLGEEPCGNLTCYKYEERLEDSPTPRIIWFDKDKFLLRKEEVSTGGFKLTNEYSYDNINIKAPSATKDVPTGKSVYDYLYSNQIPAGQSPPAYQPGDESNLNYPTIPSDFNLDDYYSQE
ncbi:hypothetical protein HY008_01645 [Candidatus Woesebacteria bacterium]|nr:hypothetical protein [Candidatus Woesebacteria bacterium]